MNTPTFSLTDPSSWAVALTVVASIVLNVFHTDVSTLVPAASTLAAGIVLAIHLHAKHQVQAAVVSNQPSPSPSAPDAQLALKIGELSRVVTDMAQIVTGQPPNA